MLYNVLRNVHTACEPPVSRKSVNLTGAQVKLHFYEHIREAFGYSHEKAQKVADREWLVARAHLKEAPHQVAHNCVDCYLTTGENKMVAIEVRCMYA